MNHKNGIFISVGKNKKRVEKEIIKYREEKIGVNPAKNHINNAKNSIFACDKKSLTYHFEKESSMRELSYSKPEVEVLEQNCSIFIQVKKEKDGKRTLFVLDFYIY